MYNNCVHIYVYIYIYLSILISYVAYSLVYVLFQSKASMLLLLDHWRLSDANENRSPCSAHLPLRYQRDASGDRMATLCRSP